MDYEAAVGTVTMSTPQFTPIVKQDDEADALDFGTHKSVDSWWAAVTAANVGVSGISIHENGFSAKFNVAGPSIDSTQTATRAADGTTNLAALDYSLKSPHPLQTLRIDIAGVEGVTVERADSTGKHLERSTLARLRR